MILLSVQPQWDPVRSTIRDEKRKDASIFDFHPQDGIMGVEIIDSRVLQEEFDNHHFLGCMITTHPWLFLEERYCYKWSLSYLNLDSWDQGQNTVETRANIAFTIMTIVTMLKTATSFATRSRSLSGRGDWIILSEECPSTLSSDSSAAIPFTSAASPSASATANTSTIGTAVARRANGGRRVTHSRKNLHDYWEIIWIRGVPWLTTLSSIVPVWELWKLTSQAII